MGGGLGGAILNLHNRWPDAWAGKKSTAQFSPGSQVVRGLPIAGHACRRLHAGRACPVLLPGGGQALYP